MPNDDNRAAATQVTIKVAGNELPTDEVLRFQVMSDLNQPDMAVVTVQNMGNRHSNKYKPGDPVELEVHGGNGLFKGELVGVEPVYEAGGKSTCVLRAFNKLHRLLRGRKSRTFQDQSDNDIVNTVCGDHGLSAQCGSDVNIQHKHVYQHNQTDLEFVRTRAARIGYSVWCEDTTLHFDKPKTDSDSGIEFDMSANPPSGHRIKRFTPRLSSAAVVKKVTVRGWDPEKKEEIVGEESAASSRLGSKNAPSAASAFGDTATVTVDYPIFSVEEAKAIAKAKLAELNMGYITGEAEAMGNADYKAGIVVKITVNPEDDNDIFNGKYLVVGICHQYGTGGGNHNPNAGFATILKVSRDAEKGS